MPNITVVFNPPNKADGRAKFEADCMDMGDKLNPFITQTNALAAGVNADRQAAATSVTQANAAKNDAIAARDAAIAASTMVASDYNPSGVTYSVNNLVWDDPGTLFRCILGYTSNATRPKDDPTHWVRVNLTPADLTAITSAVAANTSAIDARLDVPSVSKSAAHTLELTDRGKSIDTTAGVTIPDNATVAFPVGAVVMVNNMSAANITISAAAGVTLRLAGTAATGTRTLAQYGSAHLRKVGVNEWRAGGSGLS